MVIFDQLVSDLFSAETIESAPSNIDSSVHHGQPDFPSGGEGKSFKLWKCMTKINGPDRESIQFRSVESLGFRNSCLLLIGRVFKCHSQ